MDVAVVNIDNKEYTVIDLIKNYIYLMNSNDYKDILIMKDAKDEYISLESDEEFEEALKLFTEKNAK